MSRSASSRFRTATNIHALSGIRTHRLWIRKSAPGPVKFRACSRHRNCSITANVDPFLDMERTEIQIVPGSLKALVVNDHTFRPSFDFQLTEADLDKARRELGETKEVRSHCLLKLREMLADDQEFTYRTDDVYLLRYLRYRKFDYKEAYKHMRKFYVVRKEHPDLFHTSPKVENLLDAKIAMWLPYADENGNNIFIIKLGNWRPEEVSVRDLLCMTMLLSDMATMNPHIQIDGLIDAFDMAGVGIGHIGQLLQPSLLRLWPKLTQDLYPWRVRRVVFFNCSAVHYSAIATVRTFLKKKIADRITILRSDLSQLHEYVNPELLPREYGGCLDDKECYSHTKRPVLENLRYLDYEHSFIGKKRR